MRGEEKYRRSHGLGARSQKFRAQSAADTEQIQSGYRSDTERRCVKEDSRRSHGLGARSQKFRAHSERNQQRIQSGYRADTDRMQSDGERRRTPGAPTGLERDLKSSERSIRLHQVGCSTAVHVNQREALEKRNNCSRCSSSSRLQGRNSVSAITHKCHANIVLNKSPPFPDYLTDNIVNTEISGGFQGSPGLVVDSLCVQVTCLLLISLLFFIHGFTVLARRMDETLKQKLDALEGSYASPRQTLNIIRTAIIPSLTYAFAVTPCSYPDLDKWDAMIGRVIKSKHNLWRSTLTAMIREDVHSFGLGAPSIYVEYHRRSAVALVTSLEDPSERH